MTETKSTTDEPVRDAAWAVQHFSTRVEPDGWTADDVQALRLLMAAVRLAREDSARLDALQRRAIVTWVDVSTVQTAAGCAAATDLTTFDNKRPYRLQIDERRRASSPR